MEVLGQIINTSVFSEFISKKLLIIYLFFIFILTMHSVFHPVFQIDMFRHAAEKYRAEFHQHNRES